MALRNADKELVQEAVIEVIREQDLCSSVNAPVMALFEKLGIKLKPMNFKAGSIVRGKDCKKGIVVLPFWAVRAMGDEVLIGGYVPDLEMEYQFVLYGYDLDDNMFVAYTNWDYGPFEEVK